MSSASSRSSSPTSSSPLPSIPEFYANKCVLITGATGFLGKTIVEKLLRSCPHVARLYLVIRPTKDQTPEQRLDTMLTSELFDKLRQLNPNFREKLTVVEGDFTKENFGIISSFGKAKTSQNEVSASGSPTPSELMSVGEDQPAGAGLSATPSAAQLNAALPSPSTFSLLNTMSVEGFHEEGAAGAAILQELIENVSVVINCAATVNFNEKLKISLTTNVTSVRHMMNFARSLNHLEAFVHVSTAYSQCDRLNIEEKFYPPVVDPTPLIEAVESMSDEVANAITKGLIGKRPNTYTLTKSLSEDVIRRESAGIPIVIVRPSIVGGIAESPLPGWTDTLNGPGGLYVALAHALMRVMPGDGDAICDIVPVDFCANVIISMAWKIGLQQPERPIIFNCTSGTTNPISWDDHDKLIVWASATYPIRKFMYPFGPDFCHVKNRLKYRLQELYYHTIPSYLIDGFKILTFQRPVLRRLYTRLNSSMAAYSYFTLHSWTWENTSYRNLLAEMREEDRKEFNFDFRSYEWKTYIRDYWIGCKKLVATLEHKKISKSTMAAVATPNLDAPAVAAPERATKPITFTLGFKLTSTLFVSSVVCVGAVAALTLTPSGQQLAFSRPQLGHSISSLMTSLSLRKD